MKNYKSTGSITRKVQALLLATAVGLLTLPAFSATIGDQVWFDSNADGAQSATEASGAPGVVVSLLNGGAVVSTQTTDANGNFLFTGVPAGTYDLQVFTPTGFQVGPMGSGSAAGPNGVVSNITVAAADVVTANTGLLANPACFLVDDFTTTQQIFLDSDGGGAVPASTQGFDSVSGPGILGGERDLEFEITANNLPINSLALAQAGSGNFNFGSFPSGYFLKSTIDWDGPDSAIALDPIGLGGIDFTTAANGALTNDTITFDITGKDLGPVTFTIEVYTDGANFSTFNTTITPNAPPTIPQSIPFSAFTPAAGAGADFSNVGAVRLMIDAQAQDLDVTIETIGKVPSLAAIGNRVWEDLDADGEQSPGEPGIPGVTVNLYNNIAPGTIVRTMPTGPNGEYLFSGLPPGDYFVEFIPPAGAVFTTRDATTDGVDSDANIGNGQTIVTTLEAGEADLTWDAGIYTPAEVGDFVWFDTDRDGVQDPGEMGIPNVQVELFDDNGVSQGTMITGPNGEYLFTGLQPGDYSLQFSVPAGFLVSPQNAGGNDEVDSDINGLGNTINFTLNSGDSDLDWDAGLYRLVPGYELVKTTTGPLDAAGNVRVAEVGEAVTFTITISNTGEVQLATVPLTDSFNATELTFVSATPAETSATAGGLNWANLGSLNPGSSHMVDLVFTARTSTFGAMQNNTASTSPTTPAGQDTVASQTDTAPYIIAAPSYTLTKVRRGPVDREVGEAIIFDIVITNTGEVDLQTVPVIDVFDAASVAFSSAVPPVSSATASSLTWNNVGPIIANGGTASIAVTFDTIASTSGALRLNTASTTPTTVNGNTLPQMDADANYRVLAPAYTIEKTRLAPATLPAAVGDAVNFRIVVTNTGEVPLTTVPLTDTFDASILSFVSSSAGAPDSAAPAGTLTWNDVGSIGLNSSIAVTVNFTALATTSGAVLQNNAATTPSTANGPLPEMDSDAPYAVAAPDFTITKTRVSPAVAEVGDDVIFDIVITNTGEIPLTTVPLTDTYDATLLSFQSATPANPNLQTAGNLVWNNLGTLATSSDHTVRVTFEALQSTAGTDRINTAATTPSTPTQTLPEKDAEAPYQIAAPSYTITKTRTTALDAEVGETVTFTIVVVNTGEVPLTTVPLDDVYDANFLSFANASIPPTTAAAGSLFWNNIGAIGVGSQRAVTVNFTALASTDGALLDNVAGTMPSTPNQTLPRNTADAPYRVIEPSFIITKELVSPAMPAVIGDTIVFRITVENDGEVDLVSVPLTDTYDAADLAFVSGTSGGTSPAAGTVQWANIGPITTGNSASVDVTFTALASEPGDLNVVATTPSTPAGPLPEEEDDAPYEIVSPSYTITKTRTSPLVSEVGEDVTFNVVINNNGNVTLTSVPLTDTYDAAFLAFQSATPSNPNLQAPGNLVWNNLGSLTPGSSRTVQLTFTALQSTSGLNETNTASSTPSTANQTLPQMDAEAPFQITMPAYTITKTRTTPLNAEVGETVSFNIVIVNTGEIPLVTVPLDDVYDPRFIQFDNASIPPSSTTPGSLSWTNIGAIGIGNQRTVTVNFLALASTGGALEDNTAGTMPSTVNQTLPRDTDDDRYRVLEPSFIITKDLVSPALPAAVGTELVFRITVENDGEVDLVTVPVVDTYDTADLAFVSATAGGVSITAGNVQWANIGPIAAGDSESVEVTFTALAAEPGDLNNAATVPSTPSGPLPEEDADAPYEIVSPSYTITKTRTTAQEVEVGETVSFDIVITNDGNVPLTMVPLDDTWDATYLSFVSASPVESTNTASSLSWADLGPLAPNAKHTVTVNYEALVSTDVPRTNSASTTPSTSVGPLPEMSDSDVFEALTPGFEIVKTRISPATLPGTIGDNFVFEITVENTGEVDFVSVPVTDTHDPALLTFSSATPVPTSSSMSGGTVNWANLGPLPVGGIHTIEVTFAAIASTGGAEVDNTASSAPFTPTGQLPSQDDTAPFATVEPAFTIMKTRTTTSPVNVGDVVSFEIVVANSGDQALTVVPLNDTYDAAFLTFTSASPAQNAASPGSIDWTDLGSLPVGSAHTVTVNFIAAASTLGNEEVNTATTTPDGLPPASDSDVYEVGSPDYSITKTRTSDLRTLIGEIVSFEITVVNTGDVALQTVPLDDNYDPAVLEFVNSVPSLPNSASPGNLIWNNIGSIAAGAERTITVNFRAIDATVGTTNVVTTEPVTADGTTLPQDGDLAEVTVLGQPGIQLEKMVLPGANGDCTTAIEGTDENEVGIVGTPVTYCFRVTNIGDVHLVNVSLSDPQLSLTGTTAFTPVGVVPTLLAPGASSLFSANATINGTLINIAMVTGTPATSDGTPIPLQANETIPSDSNTAEVDVFINIGDFVWLDTNRDGFQDPGEPGIPGVTVELLDVSMNLVDTMITDTSGFYRFTNLVQGIYSVRFSVPTNLRPTISTSTNDTVGVITNFIGGIPVTVSNFGVLYTADIDTLDQGFVPEFATIGDTVWVDASNDGTNTNENLNIFGITNVTVFLSEITTNGMTNLIDQTVTGPRGFYLFEMLEPGTYVVSFDENTLPSNAQTFNPYVYSTPTSYTTTVSAGEMSLDNDFGIVPNPTAVELETLGATSTDAGTEITWTTGAETDSLGFYVYGSNTAGGPETQLNDAIILSQGGNGSYAITDATGYNYYRLVELDNNLNRNDYGEIAIRSLVLVDAGSDDDVVQDGDVLPAAETADGLVVYATAAELQRIASDEPTRMASTSGVDAAGEAFVTALGAVVVDVTNPASPVLLVGETLEAGDGASYYAPAAGAVIEVLE